MWFLDYDDNDNPAPMTDFQFAAFIGISTGICGTVLGCVIAAFAKAKIGYGAVAGGVLGFLLPILILKLANCCTKAQQKENSAGATAQSPKPPKENSALLLSRSLEEGRQKNYQSAAQTASHMQSKDAHSSKRVRT